MDFIKELITSYLNNELSIKKETITKNISDYINKEILYSNEKNYKTVTFLKLLYQPDNDLCGFYSLFFAYYYLKYISKSKNIYYFHCMNSYFKFHKLYKKILNILINVNSFSDFEKNELRKEGPLEREHMDYILNNKILIKLLCKRNNYNIQNINFISFDFINNNFIYDTKEKLNNLNEYFNNLINNNGIYFMFVGLTAHWILLIIDKINFKNKILFFTPGGGYIFQDMLLLTNEENKKKYIKDDFKRITKLSKNKKFNDYDYNIYMMIINDSQNLINKLFNLLNNNITIPQLILNENCLQIYKSFIKNINLVSDSENKLTVLLKLYNWLINEYHPNSLNDSIINIIQNYKINLNDENINKFLILMKQCFNILNEYLYLIEEDDIKNLLNKFKDFCNNLISSK